MSSDPERTDGRHLGLIATTIAAGRRGEMPWYQLVNDLDALASQLDPARYEPLVAEMEDVAELIEIIDAVIRDEARHPHGVTEEERSAVHAALARIRIALDAA